MSVANNVSVSSVTLTGQNAADDYMLVQFDLSWDNSFLDAVNWDACWIFVKFRVGSGDWNHATLNTSGHTAPSGSTIDTPSDGKGVFIYRSANGTGTFSLTDVQLRWNYGTDGVADDATVTVKVFAIEMVCVPTGAFAAGSGGSENSCFTLTTINTGDATTAPTGTGGFSGSAEGGYPTGQTTPANAGWPNGYSAFYCMKYEISQGQYADFLNTLTATQDGNRFPDNNGNYRHTIGGSAGSRSAGRPDRACNYLSWMDDAAYADWSGLRPMTELEFEKTCRGTLAPVANEYAWGNTSITAATTISGTEDGTETITNSNANCCYNYQDFTSGDGGYGPLRCGIFATGSTSRAEAGAGYYGIMEMSGNLWERPVTIANTEGRTFTGTHGNGALSINGNATNSEWPGYSDGEVTGATGAGLRGGGWDNWDNGASDGCVSDRGVAGYTYTDRDGTFGFRCVRSVP